MSQSKKSNLRSYFLFALALVTALAFTIWGIIDFFTKNMIEMQIAEREERIDYFCANSNLEIYHTNECSHAPDSMEEAKERGWYIFYSREDAADECVRACSRCGPPLSEKPPISYSAIIAHSAYSAVCYLVIFLGYVRMSDRSNLYLCKRDHKCAKDYYTAFLGPFAVSLVLAGLLYILIAYGSFIPDDDSGDSPLFGLLFPLLSLCFALFPWFSERSHAWDELKSSIYGTCDMLLYRLDDNRRRNELESMTWEIWQEKLTMLSSLRKAALIFGLACFAIAVTIMIILLA